MECSQWRSRRSLASVSKRWAILELSLESKSLLTWWTLLNRLNRRSKDSICWDRRTLKVVKLTIGIMPIPTQACSELRRYAGSISSTGMPQLILEENLEDTTVAKQRHMLRGYSTSGRTHQTSPASRMVGKASKLLSVIRSRMTNLCHLAVT